MKKKQIITHLLTELKDKNNQNKINIKYNIINLKRQNYLKD